MDRRTRGRGHGHPTSAVEGASATYWDIDDIQFHCRVGRTTAWRLVKRADFPPPAVIGPRGLVWPRTEVLAFMEGRRSPAHYASRRQDQQFRDPSTYTARPIGRRSRSAR